MIPLARNQWLSCVLRICLEPPVSSPKLCGRLFLCLTGRLHCCQCLFSGYELHRITLLLAKSDRIAESEFECNQRMEQRILVFLHEMFGMMLCCQLQILGHAQIVFGYIWLWPSTVFANSGDSENESPWFRLQEINGFHVCCVFAWSGQFQAPSRAVDCFFAWLVGCIAASASFQAMNCIE